MPTYDYSCHACGHRFESAHKISDRKVPESHPCPECSALEVKQGIFKADSVLRFDDSKDQGQFKELMSKMKKGVHGNNLPDY